MRHLIALFILSVFLFPAESGNAQEFKSASEYMGAIGEEHKNITKQMLSYISAKAHSRREKKAERKHEKMLETIKEAKNKIAAMPAYEGDPSYRDAAVEYLGMNYSIMKEDYDKLIDMEAIAEQSYDAMEAYINAQLEASKKVDAAMERLHKKQKEFGAKYNINIVEGEDEISKKIDQANEAINYYNKIYLIFFKSYKQEFYVLEAIKAKDISKIEQSKNALLQYSKNGLEELEEMDNFKGDSRLKNTAKRILKFYADAAENEYKNSADFYLLQEKAAESQEAFEAIPATDRTQEDVDKVNAIVKEYNSAVKTVNEGNQKLNSKRNRLMEDWNTTVDEFWGRHIPKE